MKSPPKKNFKINGETIGGVDEYIYLRELIKLQKVHESEIKRRRIINWETFGINKDVLKSKMREVYT